MDQVLDYTLPRAVVREGKRRNGQKRGPLSNYATPPDKEFKAYWDEIKEYHGLTKDRVAGLISKFSNFSKLDIEEKLEDPNTKALEAMVLKVMQMAWTTGDYSRMEFLLNRAVGKVKDEKETTVKGVVYVTGVTPDGTLLQSIQEEETSGLKGEVEEKLLPEGEIIEGEVTDGQTEATGE